jgi:hypothetical protein
MNMEIGWWNTGWWTLTPQERLNKLIKKASEHKLTAYDPRFIAISIAPYLSSNQNIVFTIPIDMTHTEFFDTRSVYMTNSPNMYQLPTQLRRLLHMLRNIDQKSLTTVMNVQTVQ